MRRLTTVVCIIALALLPSVCWSGSYFPDTWDDEFQDAAEALLPGVDWRLLKAQCYQESRLRPGAQSPVGAMGLCQFMPGTWRQYKTHLPDAADPWLPEYSIVAAAVYMRDLREFWSTPRPAMDRHMLALASYNAGPGNLHKAQKECGNPAPYAPIIRCLPKITGHHSRETIGYVNQIVGKWWPAMLLE